MRLSAKPIKNYVTINNFDFATEWQIRKDEPNALYFQLIDLDQEGLRYMPTDASYSVQVVFPALNVTGIVSKTAVQASALDRSVWCVNLLQTEAVSSGNVQFAVTEAGVVRRFSLMDGLAVEGIDNGSC